MGGSSGPDPLGKNDKILKLTFKKITHTDLLVETSSWLEPVTFVKTNTND